MKASGDGERSEFGVSCGDGRYMFYVHDKPIISDPLLDEMAKAMMSSLDELTHQHKS